jgi:large repetitive protein
VSWTAPSSNNGAAISAYVVTRYVAGVAQSSVTFTSAATTETVSGLTGGESYTFVVAAKNTNGIGPVSPQSNVVSPS